MILYSPSTCGFYESGRNSDIPADAVEVTAKERSDLLEGQSAGRLIAMNPDGHPELIDRPGPSPEQLANKERAWRDNELSEAVGMRDRHRDQLEIEAETTLSAEQFTELLVYLQQLRDWPQSSEFPNASERPTPPQWLAAAQQADL